jgi:hypothetical protein
VTKLEYLPDSMTSLTGEQSSHVENVRALKTRIDEMLHATNGRSLVSSSEVQDFCLDLRGLVGVLETSPN